MRCAGLFLIVQPDKAVLLCANRSYCGHVKHTSRSVDSFRATNFLEKISIPRGKRDGRDIFDYETAVREFIEETGCVFESAYVYRAPFVLHWQDAGVTYTYSIYVGVTVGAALKQVAREPNTFCVKLQRGRADENTYRVNIEKRRFNNEIARRLYILSLDQYFQYMNEKQLVTYDSSNYLDFFIFVRSVKQEFDSGETLNFFCLSLQLETLESELERGRDKWRPAQPSATPRPNFVAATRKALREIGTIV
ncbi:BV-E31/ADPRase [Olene mendosa nucleopolyhedrovirus]|uniref:BV-E31/ADPRase n=1 Tax=Olene mendosa nucleopolyhedrovirus TaxID=2933796 RepID=A0AAX3AU76_9ABAC|nr:BV-E31/ADPRase [Olene mendosa nucleopolyhedrovirus]UOQ18821.1 BV-E31/ADPRase [Olene mendosa nucleopolyhedrovirus]